MDRTVNFLGGLLLGALAGATFGLLVAPESGEQLQVRIRERINAAIEEGRRAAAERRAELEAQFSEAKRIPRYQ